MIEYILNAHPRHGVRRSVMSHDQTCPSLLASSTGACRGDRREASITPWSHAVANEWSTDTPAPSRR